MEADNASCRNKVVESRTLESTFQVCTMPRIHSTAQHTATRSQKKKTKPLVPYRLCTEFRGEARPREQAKRRRSRQRRPSPARPRYPRALRRPRPPLPVPKRSACSSYRRRKRGDRSRRRRRRAALGSPASSSVLPSWSPARTPQPPAALCPPLQPCKLAHTHTYSDLPPLVFSSAVTL